MATVKNLKGTADKSCKCKTWLKHWENNSGKSLPSTCREVTCMNKDLVGAHVIKVNSSDKDHYIIPLCSSHNQTDGEFNVMDGYFVSANKSKTCDQ